MKWITAVDMSVPRTCDGVNAAAIHLKRRISLPRTAISRTKSEITVTKIVFLLQNRVSSVRNAIALISRHPLARSNLAGIESAPISQGIERPPEDYHPAM